MHTLVLGWSMVVAMIFFGGCVLRFLHWQEDRRRKDASLSEAHYEARTMQLYMQYAGLRHEVQESVVDLNRSVENIGQVTCILKKRYMDLTEGDLEALRSQVERKIAAEA